MPKKTVLFIMALSLITVLISGCGDRGNAPGDRVKLEMVHWANSVPHQRAYDEIIKGYNESQEEVEVSIRLIGADNYRSWLLTQFAGGIAPELYQTNNSWADIDHRNGYTLDLTPYLNKKSPYTGEKWLDSFHEGYMRIAQDSQNPGHWNAIPTSTVSARIFYNKELFDKYDIPQPHEDWTWEEFLDICEALKNEGKEALPIPNSAMADYNVGWSVDIINAYLLSDLYAELDVDNSGIIETNELVRGLDLGLLDFTDDRMKEAYRIIMDWSKFWTRGFNSLSVTQAHDMFLRQDAAMFFNGSWTLRGTEMSLTGEGQVDYDFFEFGIVPFPTITGDTSKFTDESVKFPELGGPDITFGIPRTAEIRGKLDYAVDFLQYLTAPQNFKILTEQAYNIPIIKGIEVDEKLEAFIPRGDLVKGRLNGQGLNSTSLEDYVFKNLQLMLDNRNVTLDDFALMVHEEYVRAAGRLSDRWNEDNNWGIDYE